MKKSWGLALAAAVCAAVLAGAYQYVKSQVREQVDAYCLDVRENLGLGVAYQDLDLDLLGKTVTLSPVTLTYAQATRRAESLTADYSLDPRTAGKLTIHGIQLDDIKRDLGLDDAIIKPGAKAKAALEYAFNDQDRRLTIAGLTCGVDGLAKASLALDISQIPASLDLSGNILAVIALMGIKLHSARLSLADAGLMNAILDRAAAEAGTSPEAIAAKYQAALNAETAKSRALGSPEAAGFYTALSDYVGNRKGMTVSISPAAPLRLSAIPKDEKSAWAALKFSATSP